MENNLPSELVIRISSCDVRLSAKTDKRVNSNTQKRENSVYMHADTSTDTLRVSPP